MTFARRQLTDGQLRVIAHMRATVPSSIAHIVDDMPDDEFARWLDTVWPSVLVMMADGTDPTRAGLAIAEMLRQHHG